MFSSNRFTCAENISRIFPNLFQLYIFLEISSLWTECSVMADLTRWRQHEMPLAVCVVAPLKLPVKPARSPDARHRSEPCRQVLKNACFFRMAVWYMLGNVQDTLRTRSGNVQEMFRTRSRHFQETLRKVCSMLFLASAVSDFFSL